MSVSFLCFLSLLHFSSITSLYMKLGLYVLLIFIQNCSGNYLLIPCPIFEKKCVNVGKAHHGRPGWGVSNFCSPYNTMVIGHIPVKITLFLHWALKYIFKYIICSLNIYLNNPDYFKLRDEAKAYNYMYNKYDTSSDL